MISNSPDHNQAPETGTYFCGNCGDRFQMNAGQIFNGCSHCQFPVAWLLPADSDLLGTNPVAKRDGNFACGNCGRLERLKKDSRYEGCPDCWHQIGWWNKADQTT